MDQPSANTHTDLRLTALHQQHRALGAHMAPFGGWSMPLRYSSERTEHLAVRDTCGVFDLSHMTQITVSGQHAAERLDSTFVGALSRLAVGRAKYTLLCDDDGGVLDDVVVYRLAIDQFLVVANAINRPVVIAALNGGSDRCEIVDVTADRCLIAIQGPASGAVVDDLLGSPISSIRYYSATQAMFGGAPILAARTGYTGELGFELYVPASVAPRLWQQLVDERGIIPVGLAARDSLRLEAGMHLYGHELTPEVSPFEAGLGRTISWDKQVSFPGEPALRLNADVAPTKKLVGLIAERQRVLRTGSVVRSPDGTEVGHVTSGAFGFTVGASLALAYVSESAAAPGLEVQVDVGRSVESAHTTSLPFYARSKGSE